MNGGGLKPPEGPWRYWDIFVTYNTIPFSTKTRRMHISDRLIKQGKRNKNKKNSYEGNYSICKLNATCWIVLVDFDNVIWIFACISWNVVYPMSYVFLHKPSLKVFQFSFNHIQWKLCIIQSKTWSRMFVNLWSRQ